MVGRWVVGGVCGGAADIPRGQLQQGQRLHTDKSPQHPNEESRLACYEDWRNEHGLIEYLFVCECVCVFNLPEDTFSEVILLPCSQTLMIGVFPSRCFSLY